MNIVRVEIVSSQVEERKGKISKGERAGQDYHIRNQEGYLHNGHAYPERFSFPLGDQPAYAPGMYLLAPASYEVGREYGSLQIARRLVLVREDQANPLGESAAAKPAAKAA